MIMPRSGVAAPEEEDDWDEADGEDENESPVSSGSCGSWVDAVSSIGGMLLNASGYLSYRSSGWRELS